jgi:hypothetical protein
MEVIVASRCTLEPQLAAHARDMFVVLSDPAIYEFENAPPVSEGWLLKRYERLESRGPSDGTQQWLNWVVRLPGGQLAGYVQATLLPDGTSYVGYELNSGYWRQGIGSSAVEAMLQHLMVKYGVKTFVAVLKAKTIVRRACFASSASLLRARNKRLGIEKDPMNWSCSSRSWPPRMRPNTSFEARPNGRRPSPRAALVYAAHAVVPASTRTLGITCYTLPTPRLQSP